MDFINKVGVELEGGWNEPFPDDDPTEIYADHSVHLGGYNHIGECASKPLELEEALKWVDTHYPHGSDATCGMHVHISTRNDVDYAKLCRTPDYFLHFLKWTKDFIDRLQDGDKKLYHQRLAGNNRFCALKFIPERQLALYAKHNARGNHVEQNPRYAMLNFAKNIHGTLENRSFPIFNVKENALKAVEEWVRITDAFLSLKGDEGKTIVRISV